MDTHYSKASLSAIADGDQDFMSIVAQTFLEETGRKSSSTTKYKRHIFQIFTESSIALKSRTGHGSLKSHSASKPYRYCARDVA